MRTHPESGRKAIYINPIRIEGVVGMAEAEALTLLADLLEHATQLQYQYRRQWRPGDLVMWENHALLRKAEWRLCLLGRTSMGLLFINLFFLPESLRKHGIGSRVIRTAEDEATRRGCSRAILFKVTFQAPSFCERQGYQVLGRIECDPPGHTRICMTKKLGVAP